MKKDKPEKPLPYEMELQFHGIVMPEWEFKKIFIGGCRHIDTNTRYVGPEKKEFSVYAAEGVFVDSKLPTTGLFYLYVSGRVYSRSGIESTVNLINSLTKVYRWLHYMEQKLLKK